MPSITPEGAVGELAASPYGVLTRRQAASIGIGPRLVRQLIADRLVAEPCPGVIVHTRAPATWRQALYVATLTCNARGVVGFESAAALHRWDGFAEESVTLLLPSPRKLRLPHVNVHVGPIECMDLDVIDGIRCTSAQRTLCDLGSVCNPFLVRLAFESYWRAGGDLGDLQQAADRLQRPGQHGATVILDLLDDSVRRRVPTESALEVRVESILDKLPGLVRQHHVFSPSGAFVARVDFAIPEARVAIEAHSRQFHASEAARRADIDRHTRLVAQGWRVRYVTAAETADPVHLLLDVERFVRSTEAGAVPDWPVSPET